MLYYNAIKHSIIVKRSIYAGLTVTGLYCALLILWLIFFEFSYLTFPFFILLLAIAVYGGKKSYAQSYELKFSEAGDVELLLANGEWMQAVISPTSFYNSFFLSLHLQRKNIMTNGYDAPVKKNDVRIVIYRDAVSKSEYRLLARLLHFGQGQY